MSIKLKLGERHVRSTTATVTSATGETGQIRVEYYSVTIGELKKEQDRIEQANGSLWLSDTLSNRLHALPDVLDAKNKPIKITAANLEQLDLMVLRAINQAILDDINPKSQPGS